MANNHSVGTGNTAPVLTTVTVLLLIWASVSFAVRLWVKLQKRDHWGLDDASITVAMTVTLAQVIALCYSIHRGYGTPFDTMSAHDRDTVERSLFASQLLYVASVGFTKISAGCFTANVLTRDPTNIKMARVFVGLCAAWLVAGMLVVALRGDMSQPWRTLNGTDIMWTRWVGIEITGLFLDLLGSCISTYLVWALQMSLKKKLIVFAIFNCRLLLALPVAFRLYYLHPIQEMNSPIPADLITQVIECTAIILASITCLKPFLTTFDPVALNFSAPRSGLFRYTTTAETNASSGKSSRYYELSGPRSAAEKKLKVLETGRSAGSGSGHDDDELPLTDRISAVPKLRPEDVVHSARAQGTYWRDGAAPEKANSINKTQSWSVSRSVRN